MAIDPNHRNIGLGSHLLNRLSANETQGISIINIDSKTEHFKAFLEKRGLNNSFDQYEMERKLSRANIK